jgi:predicted Co/Zn/Cd cation transporter (cation efflux family)
MSRISGERVIGLFSLIMLASLPIALFVASILEWLGVVHRAGDRILTPFMLALPVIVFISIFIFGVIFGTREALRMARRGQWWS